MRAQCCCFCFFPHSLPSPSLTTTQNLALFGVGLGLVFVLFIIVGINAARNKSLFFEDSSESEAGSRGAAGEGWPAAAGSGAAQSRVVAAPSSWFPARPRLPD